MGRGNKINFVITGDNTYLQKAYGFAVSLYEMHKEIETVRLFVMSTDITEETANNFRKIASYYDREVSTIRVSDTDEKVVALSKLSLNRWNVNAFLYFLASDYISTDVEKIIYLDVDIVVLKNLEKLMHPRSNDAIFTPYHSVAYKAPIEFNLEDARRGLYANSGQMTINLNRLREWHEEHSLTLMIDELVNEEVLDFYPGISGIVFGDQGLLSTIWFEQTDFYTFYEVVQSKADSITSKTLLFHVVHDKKPEIMTVVDYLDRNSESYYPYLKNRIQAERILNIGNLSDELLETIQRMKRADLVFSVGLNLNLPTSKGFAWEESRVQPYRYIKTLNRDRALLRFPLAIQLQKGRQYYIHCLCKVINYKNPVRLLSTSGERFNLPELGNISYLDEDKDIGRIDVLIEGNPEIDGLAFSSTDFHRLGHIEILEFSVRPIA
jgi:lipopolysaccharide biosynthesis glycosyltransferase